MPRAKVASFATRLLALGETGELIAGRDWSATPLGPIEAWPESLRVALGIVLRAPVPMVMLWGADGIMLYNDAYSCFAGGRHPSLLGSKVREGWPEVADFNDNVMRVGLAGGTLAYRDQELTLFRSGAPEQVWMNLDYSPVPDEDGDPAGVIAVVVETTERVLAEGRQAFRLSLEEHLRGLADANRVKDAAAAALGHHLGAIRVGYADAEPDQIHVTVTGEWRAPGVGSVGGRYRLADLSDPFVADLKRGLPVAFEDIRTDPRTAGTGAVEACTALGIGAHMTVPLLKGGKLVAVLFIHSADPRRWPEGDIALAQDIAERTWVMAERARAEAALRESETRRETALAAARLGTFEWDLRTDEVTLDARSRDILGLPSDGQIRASGVFARIHPDDLDRVQAEVRTARSQMARLATEYRIQLPSGIERRLASLNEFVAGRDGIAERAVGVFSDVTEQRAAALALERSEEQLRLATDAAEIGLWDLELVSGRLFWTPRVYAMFDIGSAVVASMADFYAGLHPEDRAWVEAAFAAACDPTQRALYDVEYRTIGRDDGVIRWVAAKGRGLFENGRCVRVLGTAIDITRRKADEARLRELNEELERRVAEALAERQLLASIIENAQVFVQVADRDYRWLAINHAAAAEFSRIFGVPPPKPGDSMLDLLAGKPDHRKAVQAVWSRALAGKQFVTTEEFGDPGLDRRFYEMRFHPLLDGEGRLVGAYQFVHDVTERVREQARLRDAEARLQQSLKMEAVGQLTGGIAHDFNNLLQGVAGTLDLIRRRPEDAERVARWADAALQAAERGTKLAGQLLTFSRFQRLETAPVVVDSLVRSMRELLDGTLGPLVTVNLDLADDGAAVLSDTTQLELALLNLAINGRDAMPKGGVVTIRTRTARLAGDTELPDDEYVELEVADTGVGMPSEVMARAFDPFYTTKPVGRGTGLGLSQVYGIARQSGGTARIESAPGRGTTVRLLLRRVEPIRERDDATRTEHQETTSSPDATILVIDDDDDVRRFLADSLQELGYQVALAADGSAGLRRLDHLRPDLLLVDYAMPGMTGAEVAYAARERYPDMPIVFASGYSDTNAIRAAAGAHASVLRKPFRIDQLRSALNAALAPSTRSHPGDGDVDPARADDRR